MGEDGFPARMEKRERRESHRLIEECMLAANEAVAKFFQDEGLPSVYRFHGEPDEQKLTRLTDLEKQEDEINLTEEEKESLYQVEHSLKVGLLR